MKRVLVVFGGVSSEHEVSLISARSVIENIPADKYEIIGLGITRDGRWFKYSGDWANLPDDKWLSDCANLTPAIISADRSSGGLLLQNEDGAQRVDIDVVFPVLHGKNGEDGTIQGLLQLAGIPFVGCDLLSSAVCMDKAVTNTLADAAGIPQAKWMSIKKHEYNKDSGAFLKRAAEYLGYPIFVKPANAGSSVGISKAVNELGLKEAAGVAFEHDEKIVLEEGIDGYEVECAVLGNDEPVASLVGEIVPCNEFYDYDAKYIAGTTELHIPARLEDSKAEEVRAAACKAYKCLGCSGLARIDFFVRKSDGAVLLNEPNTIPGFTSISMYPKLFEAAGIPYPELLDRLISLAIEKWSRKI
jgi:D-alanine-D-alanine ligase